MNTTNVDLFAVRERVLKELSQSKTPSIPLTITQFVRYMHKIAPDLSNQQHIHLFKRFEMNLTYVLIPKLVENDLLARNILLIYRSLSKQAPLPPLRDTHSDEHEYASILNMKQFTSEVGIKFYENKSDCSSSNDIITADDINNALLIGTHEETIIFDDYNGMLADGGSENMHTILQEIEALKQWKRNLGLPAMAEVQKLQNMLEIYAEDAKYQQQELKLVKNQSSDMHSSLVRMQSSNELIVEENNILRFSISNKQKLVNDIQRSNRNRAKLQKLNTDLLTINENYASKNEELNETNDRNSEYIANLRQQLLECEQESAQELDFYIQCVVDLQRENERLSQQIAHMSEKNEWILQKNSGSVSTGSSTVVIPDTIAGRPRTVRFDDKNNQTISYNSSMSPAHYFKFSSDHELISMNDAIPPVLNMLSGRSERSISNCDNVQFVSYDENGDHVRIYNNTNGYDTPSDDVKADENQFVSADQLKHFSSVGSGLFHNSNTLRSMNGIAKQKMKKELMLELRVEIREELRNEIVSKVETNFQIKKQQMEIDAQIMQQDREKEYETNIAELNLQWSKKTQKYQRKYDQLMDKVKYNSNQYSDVMTDMEDNQKYCLNCLQQ